MKSLLTCFVLALLVATTSALAAGHAGASQMARLNPQTKPAADPVKVDPWEGLDPSRLNLHSGAYLVVDDQGHRLAEKSADKAQPIASVTKLMTAMVILDAHLDMDAMIALHPDDRDQVRHTGSRLRVENARLSRKDLLLIALMASENRAAAALGRTAFPGGMPAFVRAMNRKAQELGMTHSRFADPTGLDAGNLATAEDLVRMARAAMSYPFIRQATTLRGAEVHPYAKGPALSYRNTNRLLASGTWDIELTKTGFINESGHCLVMRAVVAGRPLYFVLLNSYGKLTRFGDCNRLRDWIEAGVNGRNRQG